MLPGLANGRTKADLPTPNVFEHMKCIACLTSRDPASRGSTVGCGVPNNLRFAQEAVNVHDMQSVGLTYQRTWTSIDDPRKYTIMEGDRSRQ